MFKSLVLISLLLLATSSSFAKDSIDRNEAQNFKMCVAADSTWMARWGKWIVDFNKGIAYDKCRKAAWPSLKVNANQTGCYINGHWYTAGYYCEKY